MDFSKMSDAQLKAALEESRREVSKLDKKKDPSPYAHMSDEELKAALHQSRQELEPSTRKPKKSSSFDAHRTANQFAHNMNVGIAKLADLPFQAYEGLRTGMIKGAHHLAPNHVPDTQYGEGYLPNLAERYDKFMDPHGTLTPQTKGQHALKDIAESVGTLPAMGGLGGVLSMVKGAPRVAKMASAYGTGLTQKAPRVATAANALMGMGATTASNIAATVGAPAAMHAHRNVVKNPTVGGEMASGVAGATAASLTAPGLLKAAMGIPGAVKNPAQAIEKAKDSGTRFLGEKLGYMQDVHEKFKRLNLMPTLGQIVESDIPLKAEILASKYPWTQKIYDKLFKHNEKMMADKVGVLNSDDMVAAVKNPDLSKFKTSAHNLKQQVSDRYEQQNASWAPRDTGARKNRELVDVKDIIDHLAGHALGVETPTAKTMHSQTVRGQYLEKLRAIAREEAAKRTQEAATQAREALIPEIKPTDIYNEWLDKHGYTDPTLRKKVLAELEPKPLPAEGVPIGAPHAALEGTEPTHIAYPEMEVVRKDAANRAEKAKYRSDEYRDATEVLNQLSNKRHEFIESIGTPEEVASSRLAKRYWKFYKNEESGLYHPASEMIEKPTVENVLEHVLSKDDPRYFKVLQKGSTPEEHAGIRNALITEMGNQGGVFRITAAQGKFSKWSSRKQDSFLDFWHSKHAKQDVRDVMEIVGKNKDKIDKIANTSQTSYWLMLMARGGAYAKAATQALQGKPVALMGALATDILAVGGAKLMADPKFLNRMQRVMTAPTPEKRATALDFFFKYPPVRDAVKQSARAAASTEMTRDKQSQKKR